MSSPPCSTPGDTASPVPTPRIPLQVCQGNSILVRSSPFGPLSPLEHRCVQSRRLQDAFQETGCRKFSRQEETKQIALAGDYPEAATKDAEKL